MRSAVLAIALAGLLGAGGCAGDDIDYVTEDRMANGLVVILPGIEGESSYNHDVRSGLVAGGVYRALPIYHWGRPVPGLGMLLNQMDFLGNRLAGIGIAHMITQYQDAHPNRPVYIIGHSGGGGVAVFAAEAMPEGRQVDGLVLLSASIYSGYDATKALKRCRNGILNVYNRDDAGLLGIGTTVMGNVDGMHGPSAGLIGFETAKPGDREEKRLAYSKLYQLPIGAEMTYGDSDPHGAATRVGFVSTYVAPWIAASSWPAGNASAALAVAARRRAEVLASSGR